MTLDPRLIRQSFALVEDQAEKVTGHFYALLFLQDPSLRDMFPPMMDAHRGRLFTALAHAIRQLDEPETLAGYLGRLGREQRRFGVRPEHYAVLAPCLLAAMKRFAGQSWTAQVDAAWSAAFRHAARIMTAAARDAAKDSPAYWTGRIVAHQRIGSLASVTIKTDLPYPFRPGQAAAIETMRWPRVWRPYSIANAPRADGLLTFHVRAVDGGWVSSALVNHTRVGDIVRLGAASGAMVCDPASSRDLLLVGGGTGIAPLLAIVEDLTRWNTNRQVTVCYGARRAEELYALGLLEALRARVPWLTVVPCVSHDPGFPGERGLLPDVLARHGADRFNWAEHEVYLSGSEAMMRATVARLSEMNVPGDRIHCAGADGTISSHDVAAQKTPSAHASGQGPQQSREAASEAVLDAPAQTAVRPGAERVIASGETPHSPGLLRAEALPRRQPALQPSAPPQRPAPSRRQASKSSSTSSEVGNDWQVSTKPPRFSSGSRA
jgi:NAD(P)H-flavin reductase/hemoglobin-like flavoprotein